MSPTHVHFSPKYECIDLEFHVAFYVTSSKILKALPQQVSLLRFMIHLTYTNITQL